MKQAENNVAVLLIFFTRTETLRQTFNAIREARPSHLFLYQDGPRNQLEVAKLKVARDIVADDKIDWHCDVRRSYHTENAGAWAANYQAQRWAFSLFDKCIVLEDDFNMRQLEKKVYNRREGWKEMLVKIRKHKQGGQPIYETLLWSACMLNTGLTIVPTRNMIHNAGVSSESAHYQRSLHTLPRRMQRLFTMPSHEMRFPLRHPPYVIENVEYKERVFRIMAWEHPWIKVGRSMEELYRNLRYGDISQIAHSAVHRIKKATGRYDYT